MAYATAADLLRYFGAAELAARGAPDEPAVTAALMELTITAGDRSAYSAEDIAAADEALAKLDQVLADAAGQMDAYLVERYSVPVTGADAALRRPNADLARCALYSAGIPEDLRKRCDAVIAWLGDIARGRASLAIAQAGGTVSVRPLLRVS